MDTLALFSATQRSNGGRKRHKHKGQTASIYLSDQVAKEKGRYQIGTLCHTIAIKKGAVILDSIPDQSRKNVHPLMSFLPADSPMFTDEGYPWLKRYNDNHRAVNHSARAKDKKRNVWARNRWSKDGVNNQVAEGFQRIVKHSFISGYSYFRPEYSKMYLDEYSVIKGLRVYGLGEVLRKRGLWGIKGGDYSKADSEPIVSFIDVETWEKVAKICGENITKGKRVLVVGKLRQDRWEGKDGKTQSKIKIIGNEIRFLESLKNLKKQRF